MTPAAQAPRFRIAAALAVAAALAAAAPADAGFGDGYFYAKGPKAIPDGQGEAKLRFRTTLPNDIDPVIQYVSLSLRVAHPQTRQLIVHLDRPNFADPGGENQSVPQAVTLIRRNTSGMNLGRGACPEANPGMAPPGFTTLNDAGGPPYPESPMASPPLSSGSAPYAGTFAPFEPLDAFRGYHHAPDGNPASPQTWTLSVKDVREGKAGTLRCAVLYLFRN